MINKETQKEKIRQRYKGIDSDELDIIPAIPEKNIFSNDTEVRVAVYVRVSTDDLSQTSSFELQKNHYEDMIKRYDGWRFIKIYADEGISGTSLNHRQAFMDMINDCLEGKIDLIVTKSVSRFARNLLDCIGVVRKLKELHSPVGVFFETENFCTLDKDSEVKLALISTFAQEESHNKSEIMNASIEMRFRRGIFLTPPLLGYDHDEDGKLIINEKEAQIVRLIFFMYLYGYTCCEIAEYLTNLGCKTKRNNTVWSPGSILQILQNERHCGAVYARKTWTPNYLDHKSKKNKQNRNQYRRYENHEPIISKDDFIAVQHFINNAKYGNKRILPELKVITQGVLTGFVSIHTHWAGFKAEDYINASDSVFDDGSDKFYEREIELFDGEFDFRGYEIARSQFFNTSGKCFMTISNKYIQFSSGCIHKLNKISYIEMLIFPKKHLIAIRPSDKNSKNAVKWTKIKNELMVSKPVSGAAFLPTIYDLLKWNISLKYRIQGTYYCQNNKPVIIFDMDDTEILMANNYIKDKTKEVNSISTSGKSIIGYPTNWIYDFGYNFYTHAQVKELENFIKTGVWKVNDEGKVFLNKETLNVTSKEQAGKEINQIIEKIKKEEDNGE